MSKRSHVVMIKVDPYQRRCIPLRFSGSDFSHDLRRHIGLGLAWKELMLVEDKRMIRQERNPRTGAITKVDIGPTPLIVAAAGMIAKGSPAFKIGDCLSTAGKAILFGKGPGGAIDCPVDLEWLETNLVWMSAEEADNDALPAMNHPDAIDL